MPLDRRDRRALLAIGVLGLIAWPAWQAWQSGSTTERLARLVRPGDLQMVSSETCVFCTAARQHLTRAGIPFDECFIERDGACMARYQAQGAPGTPLLFVRGRPQLGFSPPAVLAALDTPAQTP